MDAHAFEAQVDAALVDARGLWHAQGAVLADAAQVVVARRGTGVHVVAAHTAPAARPNAAAFVARALGRRIAGRLPPKGTTTARVLAPDSAHARMAVAAGSAARRGG